MKTYIGIIVFDDLDKQIFEKVVKTTAGSKEEAKEKIKGHVKFLNTGKDYVNFYLKETVALTAIEKPNKSTII